MARPAPAAPRPAPIQRRLAGALLGGLLALALLGGGLALLGDGPRQEAWESAQEREARLLAGRIGDRVSARQSALAALASSERLAESLAAGARAELDQLLEDYEQALPDAQRLLLAPRGELAADRNVSPPIGYALVELVAEAQSSGEGAVEVHRPGTAEAHVNYVEPMSEGGVLVLSYGIQALEGLTAAPGEAGVQLTQSGSTVVGASRLPGTATRVAVPGTPWQLHYALPSPGGPPLGLPPLIWGGLGGGAVLLLALGLWSTAGQLRGALREDGATFTRLVGDCWADRVQPPYRARLAELDGAVQAALAITREEARGGAAAAVAPEPEPAAASTGPDHGQHGLEVTEVTEDGADSGETGLDDSGETAGHEAINPAILRTYDIRGIVGRDLNPETLHLLGRALGSEAEAHGQTTVVVGYDGRESSPELAEALRDGLCATGREVIDIGQVPTPVMYFATHFLGTHAGIAVTGSHNPPEYNGLKMIIGGRTLWGESIQALGRRIEQGDLIEGDGRESRRDVFSDYLDRIARDVTLHRPLRVVVDCGNGVAGTVAPQVFRALGCEVEELYCEVDGSFPNHHPDPTVPENLEALVSYVRLQEADVGLAFDGDGDRLGVVDNAGHIIWADRQMMLYARDILTRNPGADIIFDVKCSSRLAEVITDSAGVPLMWKTGHSLIKEKLRETGAPLAGEMSGHLFFNDRWYGFDDATYAGARLLEILSLDPRSSAEVFGDLPEGVSTPELRVDLEEGEPPQVIERLLADAETFEDARVTTIDGLRVDFPDGWGLVRASNTQPCLVLRFEGNDEAALERIKGLFRERLQAARPGLEIPV